MKKILICFFIFIACSHGIAEDFSKRFFDEKQKPKPLLLELLHLVGMQEQTNSLVEINEWAQCNLLRKGERWDVQDGKFEALKQEVMPDLVALGYIEAVYPEEKKYEGAIVHGGFLTTARHRLDFLIKQWENGVRFKKLYFLSGERFLNSQYENATFLYSDKDSPLRIRKGWFKPQTPPKTETEMMRLIWEQSEIPQEMRHKVRVYYVHAPQKYDAEKNVWVRPNTADTVITWLKTEPRSGKYLAVSNSPYIVRQDFVLRSLASPAKYQFETIGEQANQDERMSVILDELARFIYQKTR